jgi:hypothetical protein
MGETRWSPDTCSCVLVYESDLTFVRREEACGRHRALPPEVGYAAVLRENRRKNAILNDLMTALPGLDPSEVTHTVDDKGITFSIPKSRMKALSAAGKADFAAGYTDFTLIAYGS